MHIRVILVVYGAKIVTAHEIVNINMCARMSDVDCGQRAVRKLLFPVQTLDGLTGAALIESADYFVG